ncbi:hypothetical protein Slin15195_G083780 [Septoria linicola]|uniref:Uncharacterized protein n=1 Tax=Septoria linicola TaxID=215465 RepID=A0A9Q9AUI6_9PEZI|nr:hypothetical protein Slin15195_G083780 [Septoria linicola]
MKASAAAAILAFCANSAVAAPVRAGNNKATDAEKREAEPFLNNMIPDFSKANPNDDSPFNPFDDPGLPGKRDAEPFLNNLIPDFSKANPNDDSPFNPFDDSGLPGKAKREAEPFLSGLIPDFSKANPNDDSPFNPFDDPGLPGKAKREALINPATGMRAFNSFQKLVNLPEKIGDIFKREPEAFNPVAGMRAFNAAKNLVNLPEKIGDIFKRDPEMYKREAEAFLDALSDAVSGFGGIPGVQAGKIILD